MAEIPNAKPRGDVEVAIAELGNKFVSQSYVLQDGSTLVLRGRDLVPEKFAALNPVLPERVNLAEVVIEEASFVAYIKAFASPTAICRASLGHNQIEAVLDYHGRSREGVDWAVPNRLQHKVTLQCPYDLDYAKWKDVFGKPIEPKDFAYLIEDMIHTIGTPPAADLLDAVNDFKLERAVRFKTARSDRSGTISFGYEEVDTEVGGGGDGTMKMPNKMEIIVPIFQGGNAVVLEAKIRYQMERGKLVFIIAVPGLDQIERDTFRNIGERVATQTSVPVFYTN